MKTITWDAEPLEWKCVSEQRFELIAGGVLYAVMRCDSPYALSATAMTALDSWTMRCVRFLDSQFVVQNKAENEDIAFYVPTEPGKGLLQYVNGRIFKLQAQTSLAGLFKGQRSWSWLDENGRVLLTIQPQPSTWPNQFQRDALVTMTPQAEGVTELPLLAVLGWYILLVHYEDEETILSQVLLSIAAVNM